MSAPSQHPKGERMRAVLTPWQGRACTHLTLSLADPHAAAEAAHAAAQTFPGATVLGPMAGYWHGERETAYRIECVDAPPVRAAVTAAMEHGCEAVQVERYGDRAGQAGYSCEEWRKES